MLFFYEPHFRPESDDPYNLSECHTYITYRRRVVGESLRVHVGYEMNEFSVYISKYTCGETGWVTPLKSRF